MYLFPLPKEFRNNIAQPAGLYAHVNSPISKYAVDIACPVNTSVLVSRAGKVIKVMDGSTEWGLDPAIANKVNVVCIQHDDGTYAEYVHLGAGKILVKTGDNVNVGQKIAYTGLSGCMDGPHLHFNVFKIKDGKALSLPFEFEIDI